MSIVPALIAIQITTNTALSKNYGLGGGYVPRTEGFRSLSERGLDLHGWRSLAFNLFVIAVIVVFLALILATVIGGIALSALVASTFSPWWLVPMIPLSVAADFAMIRLMVRVVLR